MLLDEAEIRRSLELLKPDFPSFSTWKYNNEASESYSGFAVWGEFVLDPDDDMPRRFFVTFDTYQDQWKGHLSIGQHNYFWSSADFGDACLLDTTPCATLGEAVTALKVQMAQLFEAFSA